MNIVEQLLQLSRAVPLEVFVFLGAILEEIVAPIPSPFVMTTAGFLLLEEGASLVRIVEIVILAALGKTLASVAIYVLADKLEDVFAARFGKFFGLDHKKIESYGKFIGTHAWSSLIFLALRSIPVVPFFPLSVVAGLVRMSMGFYVLSTFVGSVVRYALFVWIAYFGIESLVDQRSVSGLAVGGLLGVLLVFGFYKLRGSLMTWVHAHEDRKDEK